MKARVSCIFSMLQLYALASGQTALDLARQGRHAEVVRLLEDAESWHLSRFDKTIGRVFDIPT